MSTLYKYLALILFSLACWLLDRWMTRHYGTCQYVEDDE